MRTEVRKALGGADCSWPYHARIRSILRWAAPEVPPIKGLPATYSATATAASQCCTRHGRSWHKADEVCGCGQCLISRGKRTYSLSCRHVRFDPQRAIAPSAKLRPLEK